MQKTATATVVQDPENEVPAEILAQAIVDVSAAAKKLLSSRLTRRAIVLLIQDSARGRPSQRDIEAVLDAAAALEKTYVKEGPR